MKKQHILSVTDIISALGGNAEFARLIGVGASTASEMKRRGRIPAEYWQSLIRSARAKGISAIDAETLVRVHARRPPESDADVALPASENDGHFTRFEHLRRPHFASTEAVVSHVRALRDEWDRR